VDEGNSRAAAEAVRADERQLVDLEPSINPGAYSVTEFSHFADCALSGRTPPSRRRSMAWS
jgi:hypothetical protein